MRYDSLRKLARNDQLVKYCKDNPYLSLREVAKIFNISHVRVYQILKASRKH